MIDKIDKKIEYLSEEFNLSEIGEKELRRIINLLVEKSYKVGYTDGFEKGQEEAGCCTAGEVECIHNHP